MQLSPEQRRFLFIIIGVVLLIVGLTIIFIVTNSRKGQKKIPSPTDQVKVVPQQPGTLRMQFPVIKKDTGEILYYDPDRHAFFKILPGQQPQMFTKNNLTFIESVLWSPEADQVIVEVRNYAFEMEKEENPFLTKDVPDETMTAWYYRFSDGKATRLDSHIRVIRWMSNDEIVYNFRDFEKGINRIAVARPDGSDFKNIADLSFDIDDLVAYLPDQRKIFVLVALDEGSESSLHAYDLQKKEATALLEREGNAKVIGDTIFYEEFRDQIVGIGMMQLDGSNRKSLNVASTLNRTVIADDKRFLVAAERVEGRDKDQVVVLDIASGKRRVVSSDIRAQNLLLPSDLKKLYLVDDQGKLFEIKLK